MQELICKGETASLLAGDAEDSHSQGASGLPRDLRKAAFSSSSARRDTDDRRFYPQSCTMLRSHSFSVFGWMVCI